MRLRLQIILLCSILVAATSCSNKLFLKRKYTDGKFLAFKKHASSAPSEKIAPVVTASAFNEATEIIQVEKSSPLIYQNDKENVPDEKKKSSNAKWKHKDPPPEKQENKKLYVPTSSNKTVPGAPCSGLWYTSPEAQLAAFLVSIALLMVMLALLYFATAVTIKALLAVGAAVLSVGGIAAAFKAIPEGGFRNVFSAIGTIIMALGVLFLCALIFLI